VRTSHEFFAGGKHDLAEPDALRIIFGWIADNRDFFLRLKSRLSIEVRRFLQSRVPTLAASGRYPETVSAPDSPAGPDRLEIEILHARCFARRPGAGMS
jgi:hypothetical protein